MGVFSQPVRGLYYLRCSSRKVVRGSLGEAARFYPMRGVVRALMGKPGFLAEPESRACLECGLPWSEVDPVALRRNLRDYGISPHSTGVMQIVNGAPE